jgi:ADP-heptose:LPS heptosyltransferase
VVDKRQGAVGYVDIIIETQIGIGDHVHLVPAMAKILQDENNHIHLFTRPDSIGIYANIPNITEYSNQNIDAKNKLLSKSNIKYIHVGREQHIGNEHRSKVYLRHVCCTLNLSYSENTFDPPNLSVTSAEKERALRFKNTEKPSVLVQVTSFRKTKSIPPPLAKNLLQSLLDSKYKVFVISDDPPMIRDKNLVWVKGLSIRQLIGLISVMDIVIAPDSAPAWLSVALGTRTLVLFGSTDPRLYAYEKSNCEILVTKSECRFCGDHKCSNAICMSGFDVNHIMDVINKIKPADSLKQTGRNIMAYTPDAYPLKKKKDYKMLFIIPYLFLGGGETQLWYLLRQLQKSYSNIAIIVAGETATRSDDVMLSRFQSCSREVVFNDYIHYPERLDWIKKNIERIAPDVIFFHGDTIKHEFVSEIRQKPIIVQIVHSASYDGWSYGAVMEMHHYTDMVITVAGHIQNKFQGDFPCLRWQTIINGVPVPKNPVPSYRKETDIFNIGILTRLVDGKGLELAMSAMEFLPKEVNLLIGGWGNDKKYKELARSYGDRVRFVGLVADPENFMDSIDCYLLPSEAEGNSMTILEAGIQKKPLIVTPVGAVPELFEDNKSAMIIQNTCDSIANAVTCLRESPMLYSEISENGYKIISQKASDVVMAGQYKNVIDKLIESRLNPKSIAIIRPGGAGDVLGTLPMLCYLRKKHKDAQIWYYTLEKHACLLPSSLVDKVVATDTYDIFNFNPEYPLSEQNYKPFDLVIRCNHAPVWDNNISVCDYYLSMVHAPLGSREMPLDISKIPTFDIPENTVILQRHTNNIARSWGTDADWLLIEKAVGNYIYLDGKFKGKSISFLESAKLISQARLIIANDSSGLHLAHAVGVKGIGIFPSSSPVVAGYKEHIAIESGMKCGQRHCYVNKGETADIWKCPNNYKCHQGIKVEQVISEINTILN